MKILENMEVASNAIAKERLLAPDTSSNRANRVFYYDKLAKHGIGPEALGYPSADNQEKRFEALMHGIHTGSRSLLDIGCGVGDLARWLADRDKVTANHPSYTGIDIMQEFIEFAINSGVHPSDTQLMVHDLLDEESPDLIKHDIVVLSGVLNLEVPNWVDRTEKMLDKAWSLTEEVLCFNISDAQGVPANERTPGQIQVLYPDRWEAWVTECDCPYLKISGYLPYDTTFQVFR